MGLGNIKLGGGYKYRRVGALQCSVGSDYKNYGGQRFSDNPDLIETSEYYFPTALKGFNVRVCSTFARDYSCSSILAVRKRVNGGTNGLQDRFNKSANYTSMVK
ncbi:hypothetical protein [Sphingobacterium sp. BS-2]|uniref:hypothetical protein n=1 Tax=Sphingobacterium sp. BS-2 TaxID=3377129 RepID=UPI0038FCC287